MLEIYCQEYELKKKNATPFEALLLDLDIKISDKKLTSGIYDKRGSFSFSIVPMPNSPSNVPSKIFYASLGVEISGIDRTTTDSKNFKSSCETFISRVIIQEAKLESTERCSCKIYGRNFDMFIKFASTC